MRKIYPLDPVRLWWVRVTVCRRYGHRVKRGFGYCPDCGKKEE